VGGTFDIRGFWRGNLKEIVHLEDLDIGGKVIVKWIY